MSRYAQPMSQTLAEMKMNDPKLLKVFNKLKPKATVKIKHSSTLEKGKDFIEYIVKSKNTLRNGVEKITLARKDSPTSVKRFLYNRDGKVTFAVGDMAASIDDIKETLEEGYESEVLKVLDDAGIDGYFRNGKLYVDKRDAKAAKSALEDADNIMKLPKMVKEEVEDLDERPIDPADIDDLATDADKKAADKNMIMQMRKAMDVKGNMKIEFGDGKKEKVDPKILQMMINAHGKIQKPRDKEKFVAMISKSKRDMLNVAKKLSTLKMDLDKEDEPIVKKVVQMLKKASKAHAGQADDLDKAIKEALELDEMAYKPGSFKDTRPQEKGAKAFDKLIQTGGLDKKAFQKAKQLYVQASDAGSREKLKKFIYNLDTEPTEAIMDLIGRNDPDTFMKMYPKSKEGERLSTISYAHRNVKAESIDEGKMKQFHMMQDDGKSAEEIAKALKLDLKTVKALMKESLDEKYDLYHKTFSGAMQHAYDYAKKKLGIIVDPKEIDNKVATGPRKPSEGKTNKYRLKGKGGNLQIQVYNKGGSKPFELNMYKEENEMSDKLTGGNLSLKETVMQMWQEAKSPEQQAAIAIAKKEKEKKEEPDEGNLFTKALKDARDKGEKTFTVAGKTYDVKSEKLVGGQKKLDKDKDGDIDAKDFAMLRKSKKKDNTESFQRYHETKQGSLRDAVLQMWGEGAKEDKKTLTKEKKDGIKKMTDTGKEVTPVETSVKMPKVKESKNKV